MILVGYLILTVGFVSMLLGVRLFADDKPRIFLGAACVVLSVYLILHAVSLIDPAIALAYAISR